MSGHFVSRAATELSYIETSSYMKDVTIKKNWNFEHGGVGNGIDLPIYVMAGIMQKDQFNQQHQNKDIFYRPSIENAQCINGKEKNPDTVINCNYVVE